MKQIGLPFVGQYEKLVSELTARSSAYDLLVFPPYFLGDFVALGFLRDLDQYKQACSIRSSTTICPSIATP